MTADDVFSRLDDDYPAYTIGRATEMTGTTPGFLRALAEARLITPLRSDGGHRKCLDDSARQITALMSRPARHTEDSSA